MWFRVLCGLFTVASWAIVALVATHRSLRPVFLGRYSVKHLTVLAIAAAIAALALWIHFPPLYARFHRRRFPLLLLLFSSTVIGFGGLEAAVRGFDLFGASLYDEIDRYMRDLVPDERLVYRHRPGHSTTYQGVSVAFNDLGLRERPLGPKAQGGMRVLILGDSVAFGWGVPIESTFARRLETDLSGRLGRPIETINAGVCGYNTRQELGFLEEHVDRLAPDVVLLLYVDNDVDVPEPLPPTGASVRRAGGGGRAGITSVLLVSRLLRMVHHLAFSSPPDPGGRGRADSLRCLALLAARCRARSVPFVTFGYRLSPTSRNEALYAEIRSLAGSEGFLFEDVLPWFDRVHPRQVVNSLVDSHPNARGHRLLAESMAAFLVARGVLAPVEAGGGRR